MKPSHTSIVQAWFVCFALVSGAHAQEYVVKALGTPTVQTAAMAINKNGIVVGWDLDLAGHFTAVRWDDVTPTQFGAVSGFSHAHGSAVNSSNNAVAIVFSLGTLGSQAMLVDAAGATSNIGSFQPRGMNDLGVVVGKQDITFGAGWHSDIAVQYQNGVLTALGMFTDVISEATDINNSGVVVGSFIPAGQMKPRSCAWINGVRHDLGTLGGSSSQTMAISDSGFVVGVSDTSSGLKHAYRLELSSTGQVSNRVDLGELGNGFSYGCAVNEAGVVVGTSNTRAFIWENGIMTDLNTLIDPAMGWTLLGATGLTDDGRIVGWGVQSGAQSRAFLLEPTDFCYADCDGSGVLNIFDYICFGNEYAANNPYADCDGSGSLNIFDYICFGNAYAAGCP